MKLYPLQNFKEFSIVWKNGEITSRLSENPEEKHAAHI